MNKVYEASRMDEAEITTLPSEDRCVKRHGKIAPLLSLGQALSTVGTYKSDASEDIVVTVARRGGLEEFGFGRVRWADREWAD